MSDFYSAGTNAVPVGFTTTASYTGTNDGALGLGPSNTAGSTNYVDVLYLNKLISTPIMSISYLLGTSTTMLFGEQATKAPLPYTGTLTSFTSQSATWAFANTLVQVAGTGAALTPSSAYTATLDNSIEGLMVVDSATWTNVIAQASTITGFTCTMNTDKTTGSCSSTNKCSTYTALPNIEIVLTQTQTLSIPAAGYLTDVAAATPTG